MQCVVLRQVIQLSRSQCIHHDEVNLGYWVLPSSMVVPGDMLGQRTDARSADEPVQVGVLHLPIIWPDCAGVKLTCEHAVQMLVRQGLPTAPCSVQLAGPADET